MKTIPFLGLLSIILFSKASLAQSTGHIVFDNLLKAHVNSQGVNYTEMQNDIGSLDMYIQELQNTDISSLEVLEQKAFWINTYNAFTLKLILDAYPIQSIRELNEGNPWDQKWIQFDTETLSLNDIEKEKLLNTHFDARIHFALNCGAKSCPPLSSKAFTADNIEAQLEDLTSDFVLNTDFNTFTGSSAKISKIFEWYASDFGSVPEFLSRYGFAKSTKLEYHRYNWDLNDQMLK